MRVNREGLGNSLCHLRLSSSRSIRSAALFIVSVKRQLQERALLRAEPGLAIANAPPCGPLGGSSIAPKGTCNSRERSAGIITAQGAVRLKMLRPGSVRPKHDACDKSPPHRHCEPMTPGSPGRFTKESRAKTGTVPSAASPRAETGLSPFLAGFCVTFLAGGSGA